MFWGVGNRKWPLSPSFKGRGNSVAVKIDPIPFWQCTFFTVHWSSCLIRRSIVGALVMVDLVFSILPHKYSRSDLTQVFLCEKRI